MCYRFAARAIGAEKAFPGWSQAFALIPGLTGTYLRWAFYRLVLPRCGPGCRVSFGTIFSQPTAEVGRNVYVGVYCCLGTVTLEDDVLISSHVSIPSGGNQHGIDRLDLPVREQPGTLSRVTIGRDSWIGDRAVVLADVGRHCVIGAGPWSPSPSPTMRSPWVFRPRSSVIAINTVSINKDLESESSLGIRSAQLASESKPRGLTFLMRRIGRLGEDVVMEEAAIGLVELGPRGGFSPALRRTGNSWMGPSNATSLRLLQPRRVLRVARCQVDYPERCVA